MKWLQLGAIARAVQTKVPELKLRLVREVGINSSGASTRDEQRLAMARRPSKYCRSRDLS